MRYRPGATALLFGSGMLIAGPITVPTAAADAAPAATQTAEDRRALLTEREDETRVADPWTIPVLGHPFSATVQTESAFDRIRQFSEAATPGDAPAGETRVLMEQQAEGEAFYALGPQLSIFAQVRLVYLQDLLSDTRRGTSDVFLRRGELWVFSEHPFGLPLSFEAGRLDFEDDRRWWWDEDLDAVRLIFAAGDVEVSVALAQELAPVRLDRSFIDPDAQGVQRLLAEASWDYGNDHTVQLFALWQNDRSPTPDIAALLDREHLDDSDANLRWLGLRATGAWASDAGVFGYWLDLAQVRGDEVLLEFEPDAQVGLHIVAERIAQDVRGWGLDVGATWAARGGREPRLTLGLARGSGDRNREDHHDRAFRQTGLNSNAAGFGGVQSLARYGALLDPDLSNLAIVTLGAGWSLWQSSSLDFVAHQYRLVELADSLADARLASPLTGVDRDLGLGLDIVLAIEEWDQLELEFVTSAFHAGDAFGRERGAWTFGGFLSVRLAF